MNERKLGPEGNDQVPETPLVQEAIDDSQVDINAKTVTQEERESLEADLDFSEAHTLLEIAFELGLPISELTGYEDAPVIKQWLLEKAEEKKLTRQLIDATVALDPLASSTSSGKPYRQIDEYVFATKNDLLAMSDDVFHSMVKINRMPLKSVKDIKIQKLFLLDSYKNREVVETLKGAIEAFKIVSEKKTIDVSEVLRTFPDSGVMHHQLIDIIEKHYNDHESKKLKILIEKFGYYLGKNLTLASFPGDNITRKAQEIVSYARRHGYAKELIQALFDTNSSLDLSQFGAKLS